MSFINYQKREINCKVIYYGPGYSGKTTNIQHIYQKTSGENKGSLISIDNDNERTLFFDFLPLDYGDVNGFKLKFHLYSVPGQSFYDSSQQVIFRGVDGIVFVADSQVERIEENIESFKSLTLNLEENGYDIDKMPLVFQWNKRDLPNVMSVKDLKSQLNQRNVPSFEASALKGDGVFETLKMLSKIVIVNVKGGLT